MRPCGLPRRLCAMFYDLLLLLSVFFFGTLVMIRFNGGTAIDHNNLPYDAYLLALSYLYFTWQWTHGGQTPGMRIWRLRLTQPGSNTVTWENASLRFLLALFSVPSLGLGFLWALFDAKQRTLHDRYSNTLLIHE
jgi:Predicted membrane protein/domain